MVKMLIVDDDAIERRSLRNLINWSIIGIEVVGEAWNGLQALESAITLQPEIVLVDIKMPIMDGVEMAKKLIAIDSKVKIIFCSAHDDFDYAREAVNLNAFGYILKPVKEEELMIMAKSAADKCVERHMHESMLSKLKNSVTESNPLMKEAVIRDLLLGNGDSNLTILRNLGFEWILHDVYPLGLILIRWIKGNAIIPNNIKEMGESILKEIELFTSIKLSMNEAVIIFQLNFNDENQYDFIQNICNEAETYLKNNYALDCCSSYSIKYYGKDGMKPMLEEVNDKVDLKWACMVFNEVDEKRSIIERHVRIGEINNIAKNKFKEDIKKAFRDANENSIVELIHYVLEEGTKEKSAISELYELGLFVLSTVVNTSREVGYNPFSNINQEISSWTALLSMRSLKDIKKYLEDCALSILKRYNTEIKDKSDDIVNQVEKIVDKQYGEPLTVEKIAHMMHFSPNYLGTLFKNKKSVSISEYITKYRVCKAMDLLRSHSDNVTDIARLCGYENIPYFHTVFKKNTKLTPNQYRQMIRWTHGENEL